MKQIKLTNEEWKWIHRLENPKTKKKKYRLGSNLVCCCLGHAGIILQCNFEPFDTFLGEVEGFSFKKIRFYDKNGKINIRKITSKGWNLLYKYKGKNLSLEDFKNSVIENNHLTLVVLNDGDSSHYIGKDGLSHKDIAKFARENREAVFKQ